MKGFMIIIVCLLCANIFFSSSFIVARELKEIKDPGKRSNVPFNCGRGKRYCIPGSPPCGIYKRCGPRAPPPPPKK
ncbi:hypothetical protein MANES_02G065700v8 [Manihot esculenta]|uniref:Uncharacterized protein n=1 Tax=Manihot esculenta TaxID=3983 RepID=A0ACB7I678_MANES|nr:hypothetical protein MANES_02G065700v8 [Manihot esculenta]